MPQVQAVNAARTDTATALDAAKAAMTAEATACADVLSDPGSANPEPTPPPTPTPVPSPDPTPSGSGGSDVPSDATAHAGSSGNSGSLDASSRQSLLDCVDALRAVQGAQAKVATTQAAVDAADNSLTTAINDAVKQLVADAAAAAKRAQEAAQQATEQATQEATAATKAAVEKAAAAQASAASRQNNSGGTSEAERAARIAVEDAAVSSAQAALDSAQEHLDDAVLRAPVAGIVGDVPFTAGKAASASDAISLLGTDAVEVTIKVPLATATALSKGLAASVTADGAEGPAAGTVNTVGLLPDSSSGTATYPVTILVPQPSTALAQGAAAGVSLTLKSATDAVTVPNSALTPTGSGSTSFVTLIQDGKPVRRTVTTTAVGETRTAVREGLAAGDTVVLADAGAAVPASSTTSTRTGLGGAGGFSGAGTFAIPSGGGFSGGTGARR
jgi:multidrug efflux pump subunit AcrA (membrane-fusion protein)